MLDVLRSPQLQAAILAMKQADRGIRTDINKSARQKASAIWTEAIRARAETRLDIRVMLPGARVAVGTRQITARAATSKKPLRGGLVPAINWTSTEFGTPKRKKTFSTHSRTGTAYQVTRIVGAAFPSRRKNGRIGFDAASELGTKLVALWVGEIIDHFRSNYNITGGR